MSKIRILPEQLANRIAAGEVVERPASVVKELIENSLDAAADRVEVEIEGGGTRLIRIIDNGEGMDEDDVLLCLERHGTSKIREDGDLDCITSLGFRGEAIPSIGSVSKMVITSRPRDAQLGTRAEINFGKLAKVHEMGCSTGTMIEIKNLFGNTPARKKFLRTVRTELNHIEEVIRNYALARPAITFTLMVNGRQSLHFDGSHSMSGRLGQLLNYNGRFIEVGEPDSTSTKHAYGYLIPPEELRNGPSRMRFFVNGRAVRDRMMNHGVIEGLRGFLLKGKNPAGLLHLVIPPDEVDVNVHPAKHEVRFRNSRDIHFLITRAVGEAMQQEQHRLHRTLFGDRPEIVRIPGEEPQPAENPFTADDVVDVPPPVTAEPFTTSEPIEPPLTATPSSSPSLSQSRSSTTPPAPSVEPATASFPLKSSKSAPKNELPAPAASPRPAPLPDPVSRPHGLRIVGQFENLYIFCQSADGLIVIDQHAVHERLLYEKLKSQFTQKGIPSQQLLFPETVELSLLQVQLVEKHQDEIENMGFSLREFGGNSYIISAVPALTSRSNPSELLMDVLEQFGSDSGGRNGTEIIDTILSTMACRAAVKGGTELSEREIEALLEKMAAADMFSHCPHGRPVVKHFSKNDISKWFHRT